MPTLIDQDVSIQAPYRSALINVPDSYTEFSIRLSRCTTLTPQYWPNKATTVLVIVSVSFDGGQTFPWYDGFPAEGGIFNGKNGEVAFSGRGVPFRLPPGLNRKAKVEVTVNNGPLDTHLFFEAH